METFFFFLFAVVAVISAALVITLRNPVHSVVSLVVCFFQVACLFVMLKSPFLAGAQLFVYVGAIMVFFVFAVFLLNLKGEMAKDKFSRWSMYGIPLGIILFIEIIVLVSRGRFGHPSGRNAEVESLLNLGKSTEAVGVALFTEYLLPFEVISILLLVAFVGAVILMVKEKKEK